MLSFNPRSCAQYACIGMAMMIAGCSGSGDSGTSDVGSDGSSGGDMQKDSTSSCLSNLPPQDCAPLYQPIYDEVFAQTLQTKCAVAGGACHAATGAKGNLVLGDPDTAYDLLLHPPTGPPRVLPGDPACSLLVQRLLEEEPTKVMPPGNPLVAAEQCAIVQWIRSGAGR